MYVNDEAKFSAVFPARNENESLSISVPFLVRHSILVGEVLVVVDSASDKSFLAQEVLKSLPVPVNFVLNSHKGVFGAIQTGVANAKFETVIVAAADEIYPLLKFDAMARVLLEGSDFVSGTRYALGGKRYGGNLTGRVLSTFANTLLKGIYHSAMSDFTTGYKGFQKKNWGSLSRDADGPGWSSALKFSLNAIRLGMIIKEIPIISLDRQMGGESTFKFKLWFIGYIRKIF